MKHTRIAFVALLFSLLLSPSARADEATASRTLEALSSWTGGRVPVAELKPWADGMGEACSGERQGIQPAAIGFMETGMQGPALDGRCNDPAWRARQTGWWRKSCD